MSTDAFRCFQCGTCTSVCDLSRFRIEFNPRSFVRDVLLARELPLDVIWFCAACHKCQEACPQRANPADLFSKYRSKIWARGETSDKIERIVDSILEVGWNTKSLDTANMLRSKMGLPPVMKIDLRGELDV